MDIKQNSIIAIIVATSLLAACKPSEQDQKAKTEQAQQEANRKIGEANVEAQHKAQAAQRVANEQIAQAKSESEKDAAKNQLAANHDIREANNTILKERNDYQVATSKSVNQIDDKLDGLKVKAQAAKPQNKAKFESLLPKVVAHRTTVREDLANLPNQTAQTLTGFKAKTDNDINELRRAVDEVAMIF